MQTFQTFAMAVKCCLAIV